MKNILSFDNLLTAYYDCRKRKRNKQTSLGFEYKLEQNLCNLYDELTDKKYRVGLSICFVILEPKPREVWAASFRDRIVRNDVCVKDIK